MKVNVLSWNVNEHESVRFYYPEGISTLKEFAEYVAAHKDELIPLIKLLEENCVHPYYIKEETKLCYVNTSVFVYITEDTVDVLSRNEYEARLRVIVEEKCVYCRNYKEDSLGDNLRGHRDKMRLDGVCYLYEED